MRMRRRQRSQLANSGCKLGKKHRAVSTHPHILSVAGTIMVRLIKGDAPIIDQVINGRLLSECLKPRPARIVPVTISDPFEVLRLSYTLSLFKSIIPS